MEECKQEIKTNKMENFDNNDLDPSSPDESETESENGFDHGPENNESND